jgi:hypothetical protein
MTNQNIALIKPANCQTFFLAHFSASVIDKTYNTNPANFDDAHPFTKG